MLIVFKTISRYFKEKKARRKAQKATTERLIKEYNELIHEYRLVQEKTSKLSRTKRDFVVLRVQHLISKGHIKVHKQ